MLLSLRIILMYNTYNYYLLQLTLQLLQCATIWSCLVCNLTMIVMIKDSRYRADHLQVEQVSSNERSWHRWLMLHIYLKGISWLLRNRYDRISDALSHRNTLKNAYSGCRWANRCIWPGDQITREIAFLTGFLFRKVKWPTTNRFNDHSKNMPVVR